MKVTTKQAIKLLNDAQAEVNIQLGVKEFNAESSKAWLSIQSMIDDLSDFGAGHKVELSALIALISIDSASLSHRLDD